MIALCLRAVAWLQLQVGTKQELVHGNECGMWSALIPVKRLTKPYNSIGSMRIWKFVLAPIHVQKYISCDFVGIQ